MRKVIFLTHGWLSRQFYDNLYTGIHYARSSMDDELAQFSSTFAPQGPATVDRLKIILDTFALS